MSPRSKTIAPSVFLLLHIHSFLYGFLCHLAASDRLHTSFNPALTHVNLQCRHLHVLLMCRNFSSRKKEHCSAALLRVRSLPFSCPPPLCYFNQDVAAILAAADKHFRGAAHLATGVKAAAGETAKKANRKRPLSRVSRVFLYSHSVVRCDCHEISSRQPRSSKVLQ